MPAIKERTKLVNTEEIKIKVSSITAREFKTFSQVDQEKLGILFGSIVRRPRLTKQEKIDRFDEITTQASKEAKKAGLTGEKLEKILNEE